MVVEFFSPSEPTASDFYYYLPPLILINLTLRFFFYHVFHKFAKKLITRRKGEEYAEKSRIDIEKFAIKFFDYIYHLTFAAVLALNFGGRDWYDPFTFRWTPTVLKIWEEYQNPHHLDSKIQLDFLDKTIYLFFLGYRISEVTFHLVKDKGKFNDLCLHHWIAVYLITYFYVKQYFLTFLWAQQLSMITTTIAYLPILFNYLKYEVYAALSFPFALVAFFYCRVFLVNFQCTHLIYYIYKYGVDVFDAIAIICVITIVILTCFWMYVFCKYFVKIVKKGSKSLVDMNQKKVSGKSKNITSWE